MKILRATLLSKTEAESLLTQRERAYRAWWLRSPGSLTFCVPVVRENGTIDYFGGHVSFDFVCVRPALKINLESSDLKIGDTISFGGKTFKIISDDLAFCLEDIGTHCFRKEWKALDANKYAVSDVKRFVDAWFKATLREETRKKSLMRTKSL